MLAKRGDIVPRSQPAPCYNPDGTDRNSPALAGVPTDDPRYPIYVPCGNTSQGETMCYNKEDYDACDDDGYFVRNGNQLWRESCTDRTWQSPGCLKVCIDDRLNESGERMNAVDMPVEACGDGTYCCGGSSYARKNCCDLGQGFKIVNGAAVTRSATTSTAPTTALSTFSISSGLPDSSVVPDPALPSRNNKPAIIGGAVGGVLGAALIIAVIAYLLRGRAKRGPGAQPPSYEAVQTVDTSTSKQIPELPDTLSQRAELAALPHEK